ncbi:efflux RND transporter periplasmic adaptor subunit [Microvirga flavescens]|uniref:efflux RND transporter periplasmic adaptor subunit n=1 Tax=Microvirga flavescens TaxID=2249811 RepID=UPI000DD74D3B|nr:efflux RND transporter periplasmic adaptor subunit [Microvirga flavescens]
MKASPLIALMVALPPLLAACSRQAEAPQPKSRPVRVLAVEPAKLGDAIVLTGDVQAEKEVSRAFRIGGRVIERPVNIGDRITAGQLLARLDPQTEQNALRAAQAALAAAEGQVSKTRNVYERQASLLAQGFTTRPRYDQARQALQTAQAQVEDAEAQVEAAQDRLAFTEIHADTDGVVTARGAEPGEVVQPGQMIVQVARADGRDAVFDIPARMLQTAVRDPLIEITLMDDPRVTAIGRVREVASQADPVTRTFRVRVGLDHPPEEMRLGATVAGRIDLYSASVIAIPASGLTRFGRDPAVWIVDPATSAVSLRAVSVLRYTPTSVVISQGLHPGEIIVTAGTQALHPGQIIRILPASPAPSRLSLTTTHAKPS